MYMADVIHTSRSTRMFYLTKYALVVVLIYVAAVPSGTFGKVSLEPVEVKTILSITCRFDVDIIKNEFINETDDKRLTIAECKASKETCYLNDPSFVKQYAVWYTGDGALFYIMNNVEETRGTYYFCDIYSSVDCVQEKINSPLKNSTKNDTSGWIAGITIPSCLLSCLLCGAIFYILKLKRVIKRLGRSESKKTLDNQRGEEMKKIRPNEKTLDNQRGEEMKMIRPNEMMGYGQRSTKRQKQVLTMWEGTLTEQEAIQEQIFQAGKSIESFFGTLVGRIIHLEETLQKMNDQLRDHRRLKHHEANELGDKLLTI